MTDSQPSRMLAVLLGASEFPKSPQLLESRSFYNSAYEIKRYLGDAQGMALPRENILSLFDDTRSSSDQLEEIAEFLGRRDTYLRNTDAAPEQLLIYYVGHGLFTRGADQAYCLAVRNTNQNNEGPTSLRAADLATVVKENARHLKRYLVLDCCFAASIQKEFQSGALTAVRVQINREFPERGTALMCSSNAYEPSRAPQGLEHTMFSSALLRSLRTGDKQGGPRLSFSELGDLVREYIQETFHGTGVRPEVHSPDQREGDVANVPLFPNPAFVGRKKAKSSGRAGQENRVQVAGVVRGGATVRQARQARQKTETPKPVEERLSVRSKETKAPLPRTRKGPPGKTPTAKPGRLVAAGTAAERKAAEARERKIAQLENERKVQLAAKKAARNLLLEWQKRERAKKLEQKRLAKQRAEEKQARIAAEEERVRKERLATQEAAADRELKRLRSERQKAEEEKRLAAVGGQRKRELTPVAGLGSSRRAAPQRKETRDEQRARLAAQDAVADRQLKRIRREKAKAAEQKRLAKEKRAALYEETEEETPDQDPVEDEEFVASEDNAWEGEATPEVETMKRPTFQSMLNRLLRGTL